METYLLTSESVTEGHPDKLCDQVSDAILDAIIRIDPSARVACETATTTNLVVLLGEITTTANVNFEKIFTLTFSLLFFVNKEQNSIYPTIQDQTIEIIKHNLIEVLNK